MNVFIFEIIPSSNTVIGLSIVLCLYYMTVVSEIAGMKIERFATTLKWKGFFQNSSSPLDGLFHILKRISFSEPFRYKNESFDKQFYISLRLSKLCNEKI